MRKTATTVLALLPVMMLTAASVGCRSLSWKPTSMFSWNKDPDVELPPQPKVPTSPASKYTPNAITSIGGQSTIGTATPTSPTPSAYGYTTPTSTSTPVAGLAAQANGYQTGGAYQVNGMTAGLPSSARMPTPTAGVSAQFASSPTAPSGSATKPVNPYGGSYGARGGYGTGVPTGTAGSSAGEVPLPKSVTEALEQNKTSPANYPNIQLPGMSAPSTASTGPSAYASPNLPDYPSSAMGGSSAYTSPGVSMGGPSPSTASYQGPQTVDIPATPSTTGYSPGSTDRQTKYNFGSAQ